MEFDFFNFKKRKVLIVTQEEKKRKVGGVVIMHNNQNNYGTSLQGFATVHVIKKMGYPFRIIRYIKKRTLKEIVFSSIGLIRSGALKSVFFTFSKKRFKKKNPGFAKLMNERTKVVNQFKKIHFDPISDFYVGYKNLQAGSLNYDVVFVGSDQVWGPLSLYSRFYNLLFVDKKIPQFSYASSFGKSFIFNWQKKGTREYLEKMDAIGVRELRGKEIVEEISNKKAKVVLDPTLLLTKEDWEDAIANSKKEIKEPYILSYILGPRIDTRQSIMELGKKTGLKVIAFRHMDWYEPADESFGDIPIFDADCLDFIKLLSNAQYICTDSFHCTIFSILFHKQFMTFYRLPTTDKMSSHTRIDSILGLLNLKERIFKENLYSQMNELIKYKDVDVLLENLRQESLDFLKNSLEI